VISRIGQRSRATNYHARVSSATALFPHATNRVHHARFGCNICPFRESRHRVFCGICSYRLQMFRHGPFASEATAPAFPPTIHCSKIVADYGCQIRTESPKDRDTRTRTHTTSKRSWCARTLASFLGPPLTGRTGALKPPLFAPIALTPMCARGHCAEAHSASMRFLKEPWHIIWPQAPSNRLAARMIADS
jgi:hypothetical protein